MLDLRPDELDAMLALLARIKERQRQELMAEYIERFEAWLAAHPLNQEQRVNGDQNH